MVKIKTERVTQENFALFGSVVKHPTGKTTSEGPTYKFWSDIADYMIEGETEIGVCTVFRQPAAQVSGVERHMRTPEILIPIDAPFVLPLLAEGKSEKDLQAFRVELGEAIVIGKGVWHGACLPAGKKQSSYFVIFRKNTPHDDVAKKEVQPVLIDL